jgi:phosphoserine phosphatase
MTTVHDLRQYNPEILAGLDVSHHRYIAFTKGSVDGLIDLSSYVWVNGKAERMDEDFKVRIEAANQTLARKGMRVLGIAFRLLHQIPDVMQTDLEQNLTFVGLFGMIDPPRSEVRDAVALTKSAGIRTVMITGDHPLTATEIARQLGIIEAGRDANIRVLTGVEIENLSFEELKGAVDDVQVVARVSPEHKLKIVPALQERGQIVSMTGDGVNDAPALRRADIGVAMGIAGTDVSKEAADMVLLDDNFATIVAAVKEGRTIYDNIRKFVRFSVAGNIGKVLVMLLAPFLGKPIPLLPLQLLWLNLLTDGLLGLGMGVEKAESDTMRRPPYSPGEGIFSRGAGPDRRAGTGAGRLVLLQRPGRVADHGLLLPGVCPGLPGAGFAFHARFVFQARAFGESAAGGDGAAGRRAATAGDLRPDPELVLQREALERCGPADCSRHRRAGLSGNGSGKAYEAWGTRDEEGRHSFQPGSVITTPVPEFPLIPVRLARWGCL